ncbi:hypothetical protein C1646_798294 [Rhizophagus diaphanus]|nr:hypothetical protein C1646_798294 [Rhizophagus diaphanus] [Rhizophagus sp. MUCL 43196]
MCDKGKDKDQHNKALQIIRYSNVQKRDEYIQQFQNERTNKHLALCHQLSVLREDCNRLRHERNSALRRAEGMLRVVHFNTIEQKDKIIILYKKRFYWTAWQRDFINSSCGSVEVGDIEFICSLKKVKSKITSIFKSSKDNKALFSTSKAIQHRPTHHQFLKVIVVIFIKYTTYPTNLNRPKNLEIRINLELKKSKLEIELRELGELEDKIQKIKADPQKIEGVFNNLV